MRVVRSAGHRYARAERPSKHLRRARTARHAWSAIALVVAFVVVVVLVGQMTGKTTTANLHYDPRPVPASILHQITHVPAASYNAAGIPPEVTAPSVLAGQPVLDFTGKPGLFGLFGEFCPFCAAERWAVITSLARFGTFSIEDDAVLTEGHRPEDPDLRVRDSQLLESVHLGEASRDVRAREGNRSSPRHQGDDQE